VPARGLRVVDFTARQGHGLEDPLMQKCRFLVRPLPLRARFFSRHIFRIVTVLFAHMRFSLTPIALLSQRNQR
jgi:hypothetical protein